jgi:hypothetical protein
MSGRSTPAHARRTLRPRLWWLLVLVAVVVIGVLVGVLAEHSTGGPSAPSHGSKSSALLAANTSELADLNQFARAMSLCQQSARTVSCTEGAERTFGGQLHTYANLLAGGGNFGRAEPDATKALFLAQSNANTFEILGDAGPTLADYDRVLHHVNLQVNLNQLENALNKINDDLRGE